MINEDMLDILKHEAPAVFMTFDKDNIPHMVATWNSYICVEDDKFIIPAGGYHTTQNNLSNNDKLQMIIASKEVGTNGMGYFLEGRAWFEDNIKRFLILKSKFDWSRGVIIFQIEYVKRLI